MLQQELRAVVAPLDAHLPFLQTLLRLLAAQRLLVVATAGGVRRCVP